MNPRTGAPDPSSTDPLAGSRYRALSKIDEGGIGAVYLAEHAELGTTVVVKLLHEHIDRDRGMIDRVRLEAQTLASLNHPNLVLVTDAGYIPDGRPFIVMERLVGCSLHAEIMRRGVVPVQETIDIVISVLSGLAAAHEKGVVHRDIKPGNIFLHREKDTQLPKLLDFGIAKVVHEVAGGPRPLAVPTCEGGVLGTPAYMAPEQVMGKSVDARADIYAMALVIYKAIAGRGPFDHRKGDGGLLAAHVQEQPDPPSRFSPQPIPPKLEALVMKGLSKDPAQRFQTAEQMLSALERVRCALGKPTSWLATVVLGNKRPGGASACLPNNPQSEKDPTPAGVDHPAGLAQDVRTPAPAPPLVRTPQIRPVLFAAVVLLSAVMGAVVVAWIASYVRGMS